MTLIFGRFTTTFNNFALGLAPPGEFTSAVNQLALYFVYLSIARFAVIYVATFVINIAAIRTTRSLRIAFLDHTLRQEVWHFDRETNGSTATQVTTNGNRVNQGIAEKLGLLVQGLALFISSFVVALSVQWELALIVMTAIPAIFLLGGVSISIIAANESKITRIYSSAAVTAQDAISSIRTIHAFSAQKKIVDRYDAKLNEARLLGHKQSPLFGALYAGQNFILMSATALAFWQGYRMYRSGQIAEVGTVLTVVLSVTLGATSMMTIAPQLQAITNAASAASELFSVIDKDSQLDPLNPNGLTPSSCHGQIEVRNLSFAYPSRPSAKVLRNLSLHVPAGKTTALVGASGCGKSTLIGLLERWYQPSGGQILLDGVDLTSYNTKWLRSHVRLVQQEPVLFSGTVYQNVIKGLIGAQRDLVDEEKMKLVEEACRMSNAHDFIQELPEGYHTQVGERASMLSGGQKQRIAIARSIISDPKILLLDEATSALGKQKQSH
jgi:ATP-binding cassette subfamily B (MDR/TAP) protein 1